MCVSPCVFVGVCVLQRQQQEAEGEDHKNGEDFAEGFEVVHVRLHSPCAIALRSPMVAIVWYVSGVFQ